MSMLKITQDTLVEKHNGKKLIDFDQDVLSLLYKIVLCKTTYKTTST
jgi:hypothetical protein